MAATRPDGEAPRGFIILKEFAYGLSRLTRTQKGMVLEALLADLEGMPAPSDIDPMVQFGVDLILGTVHKHQEAFSQRRKSARENGSMGGRPPKDEGPGDETDCPEENRPVSQNRQVSQKPMGFPKTDSVSENPAGFPSPDRIGLDRIGMEGIGDISLSSESETPDGPSTANGRGASAPESETPPVPPKARIPMRWDDFDAWYKAYPRKEKPAEAKKAWAKAVKSCLLAPLPILLETLAWQCETEQWRDPRYIPQPARYLNSQAWLDQRPKQSPSARDRPRQRWGPSPEEGSFSLSAGIREAVDKLKAEAEEAGEESA